MASPFEQPAGKALMEAAKLINQAAAQKQQIDLQKQALDLRERESAAAMGQREQTFKLREEQFELEQQIEKRRQQSFQLQQTAATAEITAAPFKLNKLIEETNLLKARRRELETSAPNVKAQVDLIESQVDAAVRAVEGPLSEFSIEQNQQKLFELQRAEATALGDPTKEFTRSVLFPGQESLPIRENIITVETHLTKQYKARSDTLHSMPLEIRKIAQQYLISDSTLSAIVDDPPFEPPSPVANAGPTANAIVARDLQVSLRGDLKSIDPAKLSEQAVRKEIATKLARKFFDLGNSGHFSQVEGAALLAEFSATLGADFINGIFTSELAALREKTR